MTEQQAEARDLFRAAYEHRYTWDANFPGYSADIELKQGDEVYNGHGCIKGDMTVEVSGIADEEVQQSVYTQLRDIVTHRKRSNFEKSHGNNNFTAGESDDNGNLEILVQGDSMGSNYKIKNRNITQVSRVMGRMAFVIDTYDYLETPDGSGTFTRYISDILDKPDSRKYLDSITRKSEGRTRQSFQHNIESTISISVSNIAAFRTLKKFIPT